MKINVNRLCELAGVGNSSKRSRMLSEASNSTLRDEPAYADEVNYRYGGMSQLSEEAGIEYDVSEMFEAEDDDKDEGMSMREEDDKDEAMHMKEEDDADEMVTVDEAMLVQELRRAKAIMNENRRRQQRKQLLKRKQLAENRKLKRIIEEEVDNVLTDLNLTTQWVYGKRQPKRRKKGYVHQGSFLKGIGFK